MNRIVFDIETLAYPLEHFDQAQQEYLLKFAKTEEERVETIRRMSLNPFTARIIAVGMLNPDSNQGKVLYDAPKAESWFSSDGLIEFVPCAEREILEKFWETIQHYNQLITFNGRSFDALVPDAPIGHPRPSPNQKHPPLPVQRKGTLRPARPADLLRNNPEVQPRLLL